MPFGQAVMNIGRLKTMRRNDNVLSIGSPYTRRASAAVSGQNPAEPHRPPTPTERGHRHYGNRVTVRLSKNTGIGVGLPGVDGLIAL